MKLSRCKPREKSTHGPLCHHFRRRSSARHVMLDGLCGAKTRQLKSSPQVKAKIIVDDLRKRGEGAKLLRPRWVFTDKNDGLRTESRDLPLRASSRLVVPGYQDESAYGLRKDAPTCSRTSQHVPLTVTSSRYAEGWRIYSADIKSAFMKGDRYEEGSREIYLQNIGGTHDMPQLPIPEGCIWKDRQRSVWVEWTLPANGT